MPTLFVVDTGRVARGALDSVAVSAEVAVTMAGTERILESVILETLYHLDVIGVEGTPELIGLDGCEDAVGGTACMLEEAISVSNLLVWRETLMLGYSDMEVLGMRLKEISGPVG